MTLKELRISKGLNQAQCAEYLGMSTRNYQNYENDAAKANTARYHAIYQKLESYGQPVVSVSLPSQTTEFHTNLQLCKCCTRGNAAIITHNAVFERIKQEYRIIAIVNRMNP